MFKTKSKEIYAILECSQNVGDPYGGEGVSDVIEAFETLDDAIEEVSELVGDVTLKYDYYHQPYWESEQFEDDQVPVLIRYRIRKITLYIR